MEIALWRDCYMGGGISFKPRLAGYGDRRKEFRRREVSGSRNFRARLRLLGSARGSRNRARGDGPEVKQKWWHRGGSECSGKHLDLDVHISFVCSMTMDSWSEIQSKKMESVGNECLNAFLAGYSVSKETDIVTKYNINTASVFQDQI
ncbi:hypothetical protein ACLB2K_017137 [Fragaria x ananassa]